MYDFVGIVERFNESLLVLKFLLGLPSSQLWSVRTSRALSASAVAAAGSPRLPCLGCCVVKHRFRMLVGLWLGHLS